MFQFLRSTLALSKPLTIGFVVLSSLLVYEKSHSQTHGDQNEPNPYPKPYFGIAGGGALNTSFSFDSTGSTSGTALIGFIFRNPTHANAGIVGYVSTSRAVTGAQKDFGQYLLNSPYDGRGAYIFGDYTWDSIPVDILDFTLYGRVGRMSSVWRRTDKNPVPIGQTPAIESSAIIYWGSAGGIVWLGDSVTLLGQSGPLGIVVGGTFRTLAGPITNAANGTVVIENASSDCLRRI